MARRSQCPRSHTANRPRLARASGGGGENPPRPSPLRPQQPQPTSATLLNLGCNTRQTGGKRRCNKQRPRLISPKITRYSRKPVTETISPLAGCARSKPFDCPLLDEHLQIPSRRATWAGRPCIASQNMSSLFNTNYLTAATSLQTGSCLQSFSWFLVSGNENIPYPGQDRQSTAEWSARLLARVRLAVASPSRAPLRNSITRIAPAVPSRFAFFSRETRRHFGSCGGHTLRCLASGVSTPWSDHVHSRPLTTVHYHHFVS